MSDRRRNVFILLFVALLVAASVWVLVSKPTQKGLDLQGGVQLVYQVSPTRGEPLTDDSIQRTIDVMQDRVNRYGVGEAEIQRSGDNQIVVSLPSITNPEEARERVGTTAQMAFYDWEANVVGPGGRIDPADQNVTGGQFAADKTSPAALSEYDAVERASKLQRQAGGKPAPVLGDQYYLVDDKAKKVLNTDGPESSIKDLQDDRTLAKFLDPKTKRPLAGKRFVKVPEGYRVVQAPNDVNASGETIPAGDKWFVLRDRPALTGDDVKNPAQSVSSQPGQANQPNVVFDFTSRGKDVWKDVTRTIAQRGAENCIPAAGETQGERARRCSNHFAIVLDDQVISSPTINFQEYPEGISGGNGSEISGGFTFQQAKQLADLLKSGSLPLKLDIISQQQVSATLGAEALDQGLKAGIIGFGIVAVFLLAFYRVLGLIAVVGLGVYTVFFLAIVKLIPIVLTLPGIAGLILTIAVAADANIVIFERVKDELQAGRSVQRAIKDGYRKGLSAIIDGNAITFLVAFILFLVATAGVKGFALNLGVGVLISMFTAVLLTQAILGLSSRSPLISHPAALGARSRKPIWHRFDFVGASRWFFAASGVILAIGAFAIGGKGLNFGIDFESGSQITATAKQGTTVEQVREALTSVGEGDAQIQSVDNRQTGATSGTTFQIETETLSTQKERQVALALQREIGVDPANLNTNTVGPTFGETVAKSAVIAIIGSFVLIAFVIWFRFGLRYTIPILIAVVHDLLITAGIYALTGAEVTASTVAALLTIIGYSLYDTIIVFDRVRENLKRLPSAAFSQIVNRSMSEVLGRSLVTSFSTGLPTLALLLFGGETLKDFALAMLIGTISGAYSSVFIAAPVLTEWMERAPIFAARRRRLQAANGGTVPAYPEKGTKEVEPERAKGPARRVTEPDVAGQPVSEREFQEMVQELGIESGGGGGGTPAGPQPGTPVQRAADLSPEEVGFQDEGLNRAQRRANRGKKR
ncbi:protein translocase subunit SecD [Patulibacter sp. SYSU D01012]|uniref:protein translocase subunit SecD n=1 Tax=Patulibacter sp. SYSU D01012 TaxID=2817381 RepID=UPI001B304D5A|nr:protein translocase subunit SecD [Patulibacter sp. SYSU D01012]